MLVETLAPHQLSDSDKLLFHETILENPYIKYKPYPKQAIPLFLANQQNELSFNEEFEEWEIKPNSILCGAGGFGGKTYLGSMAACQYLLEPDYTCLVTRKNWNELVDTNSIWENLIDWTCDKERLGDLACKPKRGLQYKIEAPNGNIIYFKAFDHEKKKGKLKSAGYDRIINDEASELSPKILSFQHRSLRNTSLIPLSVINLSNPGGEGTDYLVKKFVDGSRPYIPVDWRDNPFINKAKYLGSLNELDYIDQQYQKYGNWHYKPTAGDLIDLTELKEAIVNISDFDTVSYYYNVLGIDLAGEGKDKTACVALTVFQDNKYVVTDIQTEQSKYPEDMVKGMLKENIEIYRTNKIIFEKEPGGDHIYSKKHWDSELEDLLYSGGVVSDESDTLHSKYNRARPVALAVKRNKLFFSNEIPRKILNELFDQFIYVNPSKEEMKKHPSPDILDALGCAVSDAMNTFGGTFTIGNNKVGAAG